MTLLPTPAVNDMGAAYTPEEWDEWTAKMQAAHGNGNGHGKSLAIEAQRLLPTPVSDNSRGLPSSGTDYQSLPNAVVSLLPTPTTTQRGTDANLDTREGARANLHNEVANLLPTPSVHDRATSNREHTQFNSLTRTTTHPATRWGDYAPAIARWEALTRPAPDPTEPGAKGSPRLSPRFVEWLMGLPEGHVTNVPTDARRQAKKAPRDRRRDAEKAITRNQQLKALGNGVVPQQAAAATRAFIHDLAKEPAA